jgi:hypothetical protein
LLAVGIFCTLTSMAKKVENANKKPFGRPRGRAYGGETIPMRLPPVMVGRIDRWAAKQGISRSEALRRLLDHGLQGLSDSTTRGDSHVSPQANVDPASSELTSPMSARQSRPAYHAGGAL